MAKINFYHKFISNLLLGKMNVPQLSKFWVNITS